MVDTPYCFVCASGGKHSSQLPPGSSTVEIMLVPDGDGTLIRLQHTELPSEECPAMHAAGWSHYLKRLWLAAAGHDLGPDQLAAPQSGSLAVPASTGRPCAGR
jgi:hypothetical protein